MGSVTFLLDENIHGALADALMQRFPGRVVRVQDVGFRQAPDPEILEFAAAEQRVVVTGDRATFADFALDRIHARQRMAGVIVLRPSASIASIVEAVQVILDCCNADDWLDRIEYLPFD